MPGSLIGALCISAATDILVLLCCRLVCCGLSCQSMWWCPWGVVSLPLPSEGSQCTHTWIQVRNRGRDAWLNSPLALSSGCNLKSLVTCISRTCVSC
jgi:hypothetical protein